MNLRLLVTALALSLGASCLLPPPEAFGQATTTTTVPAKKTKKSIDPSATAGVRGPGVPVLIRVRHHGKAVPGAEIIIKTDAGVEMRRGETAATGDWLLKLETGDYTLVVTVGEKDREVATHVIAIADGKPLRITVAM